MHHMPMHSVTRVTRVTRVEVTRVEVTRVEEVGCGWLGREASRCDAASTCSWHSM